MAASRIAYIRTGEVESQWLAQTSGENICMECHSCNSTKDIDSDTTRNTRDQTQQTLFTDEMWSFLNIGYAMLILGFLTFLAGKNMSATCLDNDMSISD